jgi:hypothetical protein
MFEKNNQNDYLGVGCAGSTFIAIILKMENTFENYILPLGTP